MDENDPGYKVIYNDEIASSLQNLTENKECDKNSSNQKEYTKKSIEVFPTFQSGLEWYVKQTKCSPA